METFEILDNFTKVPNVIFLIIKHINKSSFVVLIHIVRKTIGYNKKSDGISISQFSDDTGLSPRQVNNSIKELKEKKIIRVSGQTHKNGGKSYNRYEINIKGINTLVQSLHKGSATNAQGVVQSLHKGSATNAHTKDNRQNTIEQKKRERYKESENNTFFLLSENMQKKYLDEYIVHLINAQEYIRSETAFKLKIKKKIFAKDIDQLQDFEEWYLLLKCEELKRKYVGNRILEDSVTFEIESIYPYFKTNGYNEDYNLYINFVDLKDEDNSMRRGFNTVEELEEHIKFYSFSS